VCRYTLEPPRPQPSRVGILGPRLYMRRLSHGGASLKVCHDGVLLGEWRCITPIESLVELGALGEGP
jgi:hypothetical protein